MSERVAYVNGEFVPEERASISIFDRGLRWGDGVYDVERTFHHVPFELDAHMERLYRTLRYTRIQPPMPMGRMREVVLELARGNSACFGPDDDFELCQIVTRGTIQAPDRPNVVMYCQALDWARMAEDYEKGIRLLTASTRRVPAQALSPNAKIGNKMHLFIAAEEARAADPRALALVLDMDGRISESSSHNFFFVSKGVLRTPSLANCLPGITRAVTLRLARAEGIPAEEGSYTVFDVYNGDEAFITSTGPVIASVVSLDGLKIGEQTVSDTVCAQRPSGSSNQRCVTPFSPITSRLIQAWNRLAGLDFIAQARARAAARS